MTPQEQLHKSVLEGDYATAEVLLAKFPPQPASVEEARTIKNLLVWALQMIRMSRAHDASRLAAQIRAAAYRPRNPDSTHTWRIDA
jgi:hypothetical protein